MSYFNLTWVGEYLKQPPTVIFDVGANAGQDAAIFRRNYKMTRIIAIEAAPELYKKMVSKNLTNNIEMYHFAVCDTDGSVEFYPTVGKFTGSGSIYKPRQAMLNHFVGMKFGDVVNVPATRLDTFCDVNGVSNIDILHMDIQAAEYNALIGLGKIRPTLIFLEVSLEHGKYYHNDEKNKTSSKLVEMGYELKQKIAGDELWKSKI